jgi:hypothetical protein
MDGGSHSSQLQQQRRRRVTFSALLAVLLILGVALLFAWLLTRRRVVEIHSKKPLWTASLTGTNGDTAEIWIWTPSATLRTNLPVPAELRMDSKNLFLQVRSAGHHALRLDVEHPEGGSGHAPMPEGFQGSAAFYSWARIPFLPLGGYGCWMNSQMSQIGLRPIFGKPPYLNPSSYDLDPSVKPESAMPARP